MKLVLTLMVRDEADIIGAMLEHHFSQGISQAIITDNGSVDGTWEILKKLSHTYPIEIRREPIQRKQQSSVVTKMARDAYKTYGASWVINADADEFWLPQDRTRRLVDVIGELDPALQSFTVPVRDMTGPPALSGTGLQRLVYQDPRSTNELRLVGLRAPSTHDCLHIGSPDVEVAQGNHMVSLPSAGAPPQELALEVLHFPWRSWEQFARKVSNAGTAYRANPNLQPSPNHHGMRDYKRYEAGLLLPHYVARSMAPVGKDPTIYQRATLDRVIATSQHSPVADHLLSAADWNQLRELGLLLIQRERLEASASNRTERNQLRAIGLRIERVREGLSRRTRTYLQAHPK